MSKNTPSKARLNPTHAGFELILFHTYLIRSLIQGVILILFSDIIYISNNYLIKNIGDKTVDILITRKRISKSFLIFLAALA